MLRRLSFAVLSLMVSAYAVEAKDGSHVDETALRYYASLGQKERVAAETKRLQALDANWHVPDDLYTAQPGRADEGPLWQLYKEGRFDDIAKAIATRQAAEPGWTPSDDLMTKIKTKQLRSKIMTLAKASQWQAIVQSLNNTSIAWARDDAEVLWAIAEAYAREHDPDKAFAVYKSILTDHTDSKERNATIEYAIPLIPMSMTEKLIASIHAEGTGETAFDSIDVTRARISAFLHDEPANDLSDAEFKRFEDFVRTGTDPHELSLLAWYQFRHHNYPAALEWFKLAIAHGGDAMVAHGLAHTLRKLDRTREAEEIAYAWRDPLINNSILFIDILETELTKEQPPFIAPERIARYAQVTMATESGEGAQALGWYAYNTCQYPLALQWFERATAWLPKEATVFGYALSLQRLHRTKDFRDVVNRYDGLFPKVVALAFDDGSHKPASQCDANPSVAAAPQPQPMIASNGLDWNGRTMADTLRPQTVVAVAQQRAAPPNNGRPRVPSPDAAAGGSDGALPVLKKTTDFPISISPENPLRFSAFKTFATGAVHDQVAGNWPLVARRVSGVGPMFYERYGFTLLPGADGNAEASSTAAADQNAPAGTLWASEQSLPTSIYNHPTSPKPLDTQTRFPIANANAGNTH